MSDAGAGDSNPSNELMPLVYDELRRLAGHIFKGQDRACTLQPTALVHDAYLKLQDRPELEVEGRTHFFNLAARAMRQILTDHYRARGRLKRGANAARVTLDGGAIAGSPDRQLDLVDLMDALERLAELNERHGDVVTLRVFGGLTVEEVADELGVSKRTVESDWHMARAWMMAALQDDAS